LIKFNPDGAAADHADADGSPHCCAASRTRAWPEQGANY
jgi:hypothetical protein